MVITRKGKVKFDIIPKTNEEYISLRYGSIRFIDGYRFLSTSLYSLVKTLVDNSHKTIKNFKEEIVDNDEILNIVNEIEEEDRTIEGLKKDYTGKNEKMEEAVNNYITGTYFKNLKTEIPGKWKYPKKNLAYPYEYFNIFDDYHKPNNNFKKRLF